MFTDIASTGESYNGGTSRGTPETNSQGIATGWVFSPMATSGTLEALATANGITWYSGHSAASVSWTGHTVTEQSPVPGQPNVGTVVGIAAPAVNQLYQAQTVAKNAADSRATIGIFAESSYTASDLATYFQALGITPPSITVVPVDGTASQIVNYPGWHGELELDLEMAGAAAPGSQITVYTLAEGNATSPLDPLDVAAAAVNADAVSVLSFSMAMPEDALPPAYLNAWNQVLEEGTAEGMSFVSAAGDTGAYGDPYNPGIPTVSFPASDPYVTAVGGTQVGVNAATGSLDSQTAWSPNGSFWGPFFAVPAAGGGGYSAYFPTPSYQSAVNGNPMRGVSDVAFMATWPWYLGYNSSYASITSSGNYVSGWNGVGGTSASTPLWAGYLADLIAQSGQLGNANPTLYGVYQKSPTAFSPVTQGNNLLYHAGPGWNPVAGLGSVNVDALATDLNTLNVTNAVYLSGAGISQVAAGEQVTVQGTGFGATQGAGYVHFSDNGINWGAPGNLAAFHIDSWSNTAITFTVPQPSGTNGQWAVTPNTTATVAVTNSAGQTSSALDLGVKANVILAVSPASGATASHVVTLTGSNFGSTQGSGYVQFSDNGINWGAPGNLAAFHIDSWSNTAITFTVPQPSGTNGQWAVSPGTSATIAVVTNGSAGNTTTLPITGLTITGTSPSSQFAGQTVTITGNNFGSAQGNGYIAFTDNGVNWGAPGNAASFQINSWSNTAVTFTVPEPSGNNGQWAVASFTLNNNAGVSSTPQTVAITSPTPSIAAVSPSSASAGATVTITGTNFGSQQGVGYVQFSDNGINWGAPSNLATFHIDSWSNTAITFTVPQPSGTNGQWAVTPGSSATINVTNSAGQSSSNASLAITS